MNAPAPDVHALDVHARDLDARGPETVLVPGGAFWMGSDDGRPDERPRRLAEVASFRLARTPVTRAQYEPFLATGAAAPPWWDDPDFRADDQPVVGVTWYEAAAYCAWLGEETGATWRLPDEAEWERAARGGLAAAPTAWGDELPPNEVPLGPLRGPWPVGRGTPNGYGLLDPGTVVHEWCRDDYVGGGPAPIGASGGPLVREPVVEVRSRSRSSGQAPPPAPVARKASRGGSWRHRVRWSPPAARSSLPPSFRYADYGFRPLRELS